MLDIKFIRENTDLVKRLLHEYAELPEIESVEDYNHFLDQIPELSEGIEGEDSPKLPLLLALSLRLDEFRRLMELAAALRANETSMEAQSDP